MRPVRTIPDDDKSVDRVQYVFNALEGGTESSYICMKLTVDANLSLVNGAYSVHQAISIEHTAKASCVT